MIFKSDRNALQDKVSTDQAIGRQRLLEYLRAELVGPAGGDREIIEREPPQSRYILGVLYPKRARIVDTESTEEADDTAGSVDPASMDDPVALTGQWMPSAMGLTFFFRGTPEIQVRIQAAQYEKLDEVSKNDSDKDTERWQRIPLTSNDAPEIVTAVISGTSPRREQRVLGGAATLHTHWRQRADGWLVTVALVNNQTNAEDARPETRDCLFQTSFECITPSGQIQRYPEANVFFENEEEEELQLLYRNVPVYAIGHGCAADWETRSDGKVQSVFTDVLPSYEVPSVTFQIGQESNVLKLARLADPDLDVEILAAELRQFVSAYQEWIDHLPEAHPKVPARLSGAKIRILERLNEAVERMYDGIRLLQSDPVVLNAFRLANRAMLMQMYHGLDQVGGKRRKRNDIELGEPQYLQWQSATWRPFQLAYQLLTLESVVNDQSKYRETVDLIWFPTGGGKTEAYLAVAAFEIFLRRLRHGDRGAGTAVITRYTLRLLTAQQFQRAARLICACELIRQSQTASMGSSPITLGLWVGDATSPNRFQDARQLYSQLLEDQKPECPFPLEQCPWCGTEIVPQVRKDDPQAYGIEATNAAFKFFCPSNGCCFHDGLPIQIIDEGLYQQPPTFLVATVDKFARLAWVGEAGTLFGGITTLPPSLIIQDELHLLSGPLGTTAGLYERAIEALIKMRGGNPKVIASTATIRSAGEQALGLFGKCVRQFPPPGFDAADSYFTRLDYSRPGRLYVGVLSSSHRPATSLIRVSAGLLQGVHECELTDEELDAYWTLIIYHNSLRELGKTVTYARDDIPARIDVIASDHCKMRKLTDENVLELTSNITASEIPKSISRIGHVWNHPQSVSLLASTNMISVGVDFARLGLMVINGQPKTTSEYIQASSRVGRSRPGLVIAHYSSNKPRDRSHYESFRAYHAALYRHVEPTSVTPFATPSRVRALHAVLVILVRHGVGLSRNEDAQAFRKDDPAIQQAVQHIARAASIIDSDEADTTFRELDRLVTEWDEKAKQTDPPLHYYAQRPFRSLLGNFDQNSGGWPTLHSMRSVDRECKIDVLGEN